MVDVILTIVDKLTQPDMIVQLVNAALQIIIALTEGIIKALPQLIARVPEIIINIVKALIESLPMIFEAAVQQHSGEGRGARKQIRSTQKEQSNQRE